MLKIKKNGKNKSLKRAPAGTYESCIKKVRWAEGAENEEAFEIVYDLENADGEKYWHREIFKNTEKNPRSRKFFEYLLDNGIEDRLIVKRNVAFVKRIATIVSETQVCKFKCTVCKRNASFVSKMQHL